MILSLLMGMIKHFQSTQSNKFARSLQYLKKEVRDGVHFLHADEHQSFYSFQVFKFTSFYKFQTCPNHPKQDVGNVFAISSEKLSQLLLCSIVIQNIQIFYGGPVVFVVTSFSHAVRHLSKLEIDHVILVGCCTNVWACPKFFVISCQYLWKQMSSCLVFLYMVKHR